MTTDIICQCYPGQVPEFAEQELARLHPSRYSSLAHLDIYGHSDGASTYVARRGDTALSVLLYRRQGPLIRVLNEGFQLDPAEARRFADHMLRGPDAPAAVLFRAVEWSAPATPLVQSIACEQDSILPLPASVAAYREQLGASTRATLNNRLNKLRREHPSFTFSVYHNGQIDPAHVQTLIGLHRRRLEIRQRTTIIDAEEERRIQRMAARCGLVAVASIDGRCCAGAVAYRHGSVASGRVLAHDSAYDQYRLGFLCAYMMTCHCIEMGGLRQFHFGWGRQPYKFHLGARQRTLSDVILYRSHWQRLRLAPLSARQAFKGMAFSLRQRAQLLRKAMAD